MLEIKLFSKVVLIKKKLNILDTKLLKLKYRIEIENRNKSVKIDVLKEKYRIQNYKQKQLKPLYTLYQKWCYFSPGLTIITLYNNFFQ